MHIVDLAHTYPTYTWVLIIVLGLVIGSFLNVVICRLPVMLERQWKQEAMAYLSEEDSDGLRPQNDKETYNLCYPRSHCPHCSKEIKAWQNIPVISFLVSLGKCRHCDAKISWQYPLVELGFMLLALTMFWTYGFTAQALFACVFLGFLLCCFFIDWQTMLLPDQLTQPLLWIGLIANINANFVPLKAAVLGAIAGYVIMWVIFYCYKLVTKKDAMGEGDFKLLAALGAWMGFHLIAMTLVLAAILTLVAYIGIRLVKGNANSQMPFGPALAAAGFIMLPWGQNLFDAYVRLVS